MRRKDIPSLDDLRAFEAVARLGSVRAAADDLALTHSAVSRRVTKLSNDIDVKLFSPLGRGIEITPEGEKLQHVIKSFFVSLTATLKDIKVAPKTPPVLLSCERSVTMRWLIPHFSHFHDNNPDIPVNLSVGGGFFDLDKDGITIAIRRLDFNIDPSWVVEKLFDEEVGPILISSLQEKFESGNYTALCSKTRKSAWGDYLKANPTIKPPKEYMYLDHHFLMVEAAINGLGVAMCPKVLIVSDVEASRIDAPYGFQKDGTHYVLIYDSSKNLTVEGKAVRDWILNVSKKEVFF